MQVCGARGSYLSSGWVFHVLAAPGKKLLLNLAFHFISILTMIQRKLKRIFLKFQCSLWFKFLQRGRSQSVRHDFKGQKKQKWLPVSMNLYLLFFLFWPFDFDYCNFHTSLSSVVKGVSDNKTPRVNSLFILNLACPFYLFVCIPWI